MQTIIDFFISKYKIILGLIVVGIVLIFALVMVLFSLMQPQNDTTTTSDISLDINSEIAGRAKVVYDRLTQQENFTPAGAAGGVAVAERESGIDPLAYNAGGNVVGVMQWSNGGVNGNRYHDTPRTMDAQMDLMSTELNSGYKETKEVVGKATDPGQAALDWSKLYEGVSLTDPQTKPEQIKAHAQAWYTFFTGGQLSDEMSGLIGVNGSGTNTVTVTGEKTSYYDNAIADGLKQIGKPYMWGNLPPLTDNNPVGFDCSGLVSWMLGRQGISLPRTAQEQYDATQRIADSEHKAGDLLFFEGTTSKSSYITHVAMSMGGDKFIGAQGSATQLASLTDSYWKQHFVGYGRVK
ncbi:NlpC/P60 family protein [Periweissella cryptocerci]|uniref:NlpC/P60 family protein n=1 Tax=Periweissella cryptocerci TaxID=2506420 RepID=A0A4P6YQV4_9LACO|nr:phage tail tip lysozyme [Periweissella cryptocerci]QBO34981.1 NlpC/P60 family protein [Periweissella cryptocerci]